MGTRRFALFVGLLIAIGAVPLGSPQPVAAVSSTLVINEIDYDQVGTDTLEYVELKNVSAGTIDLTGYSVEFMNGSSGTAAQYQNIALTGNLVAGGYFVICGGTVTNCNIDSTTNQDYIQNGATDAIAIRQGATFIDALGYEGPIPNSPAYTEGTATNTTAGSGADSNTAVGSLNRCADGNDTDNNDNDFEFRSTLTPGTANDCPAGPPSLSVNDVSQDEGNAGTANFSFTVSLSAPAQSGGVTFDIATADGTAEDDNPATEDDDYIAQSLTGQTISEGNSTFNFTVVVNGDADIESSETFFVNVTNVTGATVSDGQGLGTIQDDDDGCGGTYTPIHDIQGNNTAVPVPGVYTTEGIVTGDFEGGISTGLQGFWIQEPAADADPMTSEGIFVYTGVNASAVSVGQRVRIEGFARERFNETAINGSDSNSAATTDIEVCSSGNSLPATTAITLPLSDATYLERFEGMRVQFTQELVIAEYFEYGRFGEIVLALPLSGEPRPFSGTALDEPGAAASARTAANLLRRIRLDDGLGSQNPEFLRHPNGAQFTLANKFRGGDTVTDVIGVLAYQFSSYRIEPTTAATHSPLNPRPAAPSVGGDLQVAAMNTLNFFISTGSTCGPSNNAGCRGHNDTNELQRQRDKLVQAIGGLDAEVVGLNELENTTGVDPLGDPQGLVPALNAAFGAGTYALIDTGVIGTDVIRVGLIYKPAAVTPIGGFEILSTADDARFLDTKSRPVLAQTFEDNATGGMFTVAVVHLKSKGSDCNDVGDPDAGDGQGNCNGTRTNAAAALVDWLATDPTGSGDADFIIVGDMNAYAREDPIDTVLLGADDTAGTEDDYVDLHDLNDDAYDYSYVFDGQFGYLDHALAITSLASQVTESSAWHINADEPNVFDYDTTFKGPQQEALYEPNAYRSSDHDPVVTGLDLLGCNGAPFTDVPDEHPFCEEIDWVKDHGIATGFGDGTYRPDASVTRQAMAAFLARLSRDTLTPGLVMPFSDVPIDHPFCQEIKWMKDNGISTGFNDGTYRGSIIVTRQAMAAFLARLAGPRTLDPCTVGPYTDVPADHAFCPEITWLHNSGITNGFEDGTYRPADPVTRQAMAAFMYRTSLVLSTPT